MCPQGYVRIKGAGAYQLCLSGSPKEDALARLAIEGPLGETYLGRPALA
jgi:hypothetical protein